MRKLSFEENLRHRLEDLPRFRYREEKSPAEGLLYLTLGAVAGIAAGVVLAQKYGGFGAIASRLRDRFGAELDEMDEDRGTARGGYDAHDHYDDDYDSEEEDEACGCAVGGDTSASVPRVGAHFRPSKARW